LEKGKHLDFDNLISMAELIEGTYTFTVMDRQGCLYVIKGDSPFTLYHFKRQGFYLYTSTEDIMKKVLQKMRFDLLSYEKVDIKCGEILKIDSVSGDRHIKKFNPARDNCLYDYFYTPLPYWSHSSYCHIKNKPKESYRTYLDEILSYAQNNGFSLDDIELLLNCGYCEYEIEELLYDPIKFRACINELNGEDINEDIYTGFGRYY
jgi:hypothetical protein